MDVSKLPHTLEVGWYTFKRFPRKRITLKSFDDCMRGEDMPELCRTMAEMTLGNLERTL